MGGCVQRRLAIRIAGVAVAVTAGADGCRALHCRARRGGVGERAGIAAAAAIGRRVERCFTARLVVAIAETGGACAHHAMTAHARSFGVGKAADGATTAAVALVAARVGAVVATFGGSGSRAIRDAGLLAADCRTQRLCAAAGRSASAAVGVRVQRRLTIGAGAVAVSVAGLARDGTARPVHALGGAVADGARFAASAAVAVAGKRGLATGGARAVAEAIVALAHRAHAVDAAGIRVRERADVSARAAVCGVHLQVDALDAARVRR